MRVLTVPHPTEVSENNPSGIQVVVQNYTKYLPEFDIEIAEKDALSYDLQVVHAGLSPVESGPIVSHCHGLYWCQDYSCSEYEYIGNRDVVSNIRKSILVTVPSAWVAETFWRDMHMKPHVIPHGIDISQWSPGNGEGRYVLWNKNRNTDACDPTPMNRLASMAKDVRFLSTFAAHNPTLNVKTTGRVSHAIMKEMLGAAWVYLSTAKETFGIGILEAMAVGLPVLAFREGGAAEIVVHGETGYLAEPGNYNDLHNGLRYCLEYREILGRNGRDRASQFSWRDSAYLVSEKYHDAIRYLSRTHRLGVVIPMFNKAITVLRAIKSAAEQTRKPDHIVVVNNNSTDNFQEAIDEGRRICESAGIPFMFINCEKQGVAHARNAGISLLGDCDYVCCLDADDEIKPRFLDICANVLDREMSVGVTYTGLEAVSPDGLVEESVWPGEYDFDAFIQKQNQVPTCAVFRRFLWERLGGYRQRYAPRGAGAEDAEFYLRMGAIGYRGKKATSECLFRYYVGGSVSGDPSYEEPDWIVDKPWARDGIHPFASVASPGNGMSHPVHQFDSPLISIIIPCAPYHTDHLIDSIDSLEIQGFRDWEAHIIIDGQTDYEKFFRLTHSYPFARFHVQDTSVGAGAARNIGASHARGKYLVFLDADDWFTHDALSTLLYGLKESPDSIIYADYIGHAYIEDQDEINKLRRDRRLLAYDENTLEARIRHYSLDYECERAIRQPANGEKPYIWNIISSLVPKSYHDKIGGFDESMESWEDWDYWIRMARAGYCFHRVAHPVLKYRFYTGERRKLANPAESGDDGRHLATKLLKYMHSKYQKETTVPCGNCGKNKSSSSPITTTTRLSMNSLSRQETTMPSDDMVLVELIDGNVGEHLIAIAGQSYGYHKDGDKFYMSRQHASLDRRVREVQEVTSPAFGGQAPSSQPQSPPPPVQTASPGTPDEVVDFDDDDSSDEIVIEPDVYDFTQIWGISEERRDKLIQSGIRSLDGLIMFGVEGLQDVLEIGDLPSRRIISEARKVKAAEENQ